MLSAAHAEELKESWARLEDARRDAALHFLQRLLAEVPSLRSRMPADPEAGVRRVLTLVDFLVQHAGDPEAFVRTLRGLARRYLDESIGRREIHEAGLAWMWALERHLGPELTPPRVVAWSQLLAFTLRTLREAAPVAAL